MRPIMRLMAVLAVVTASGLFHTLKAIDAPRLTDSLRVELSKARTSYDSIAILYNIFDLSPYSERERNVAALMDLARRTGNVTVQLDMLRQWANVATTLSNAPMEYVDSVYNQLEAWSGELPESEELRQTKLFISASRATAHRFTDEEARAAEIRAMIQELNEEETGNRQKLDSYGRVDRLFKLVAYLAPMKQGALLSTYIDELDKEIEKMPKGASYAVRNKFYTVALNSYSVGADFEKSNIMSRRLLDVTDRLQKDYAAHGRKFRDFSIQRYVIKRRMMRGYEVMSEGEIDSLWTEIQEIGAKNPDVAADMEANGAAFALWSMKHGRYADALPRMPKLVEKALTIDDRRYWLQQSIKAAKATGDKEALLNAAVQYGDLLEEFIKLRSGQRMQELKMVYDLSDMRKYTEKLEDDKEHTVAAVTIGALVLLLALAIVFIIVWRRFHRMGRQLKEANEKLKAEKEAEKLTSERLLVALDKVRVSEQEKAQLIGYVTHSVLAPLNTIVEYSQMLVDNVGEGDEKKYLQQFSQVIEDNARLLRHIGVDVQEISMLDSKRLHVDRKPSEMNQLASRAIDAILPELNPAVDISFIHSKEEKLVADTDPNRVEAALLNLLGNAAKFTQRGSITVSCEQDAEKKNIIYTITDTGCGVPADKAYLIFERFEKLDPNTPGTGLGLYICAMVAHVLGGKVWLDTSYTGGARFKFEVPIVAPPKQKS